MAGLVAAGENGAVNLRMKGLDAAIEHFRKSGEFLHRFYPDTRSFQRGPGATRGEQLDPMVGQSFGELRQSVLVRHSKQRTAKLNPICAHTISAPADPRYAFPDRAQHLVRDGLDQPGHIVDADHRLAGPSPQYDFILDRRARYIGDVDSRQIHRDRADHGRAFASNQDFASILQASFVPVRITHRQDPDGAFPSGAKGVPVADAGSRAHTLDLHQTRLESHHRAQIDLLSHRGYWREAVDRKPRT